MDCPRHKGAGQDGGSRFYQAFGQLVGATEVAQWVAFLLFSPFVPRIPFRYNFPFVRYDGGKEATKRTMSTHRCIGIFTAGLDDEYQANL